MTDDKLIDVMARAFLASKDIRGRDMGFKISGKVYNGDVYEAMTAALSAIKAAGLAVVPVEPTLEMLKDGAIAFYDSKQDVFAARLPEAYRAMIGKAGVE